MSVLTQEQLKALFETDDMPTQQDFTDLIDTLESNSAVITTAVTGTGDVWTDVNTNNTIVQTTKQINIINHNGTYYMFNAGVGSFGLGNSATTSANYIAISNPLIEGTIPVQKYVFTNSTQESDMSLSNMITQINASETLTHNTNEITTVHYKSAYQYRTEGYYLFTGDAGTYGQAATQVGSANFIDISVVDPISNLNVSSQIINNPVGDIWTFVNANANIQVLPGNLKVLYYGTKVYLFNPKLDVYGNPQIFGVGAVSTDPSNYILLVDSAVSDILETRTLDTADYENSVGQNFDLSVAQNFKVIIDDTIGQPVTFTILTATNLVDGQSGYIYFARAESTTIGNQWTWSSNFLLADTTDLSGNLDSDQYYQYECIGDKVVIYKISTWDRPFP